MSLGNAILRPQGLEQPPVHGPGRAFEVAWEFWESLMAEPAGLEATLEALVSVGSEALPAFLDGRRERMRKAEGRFRKILAPVNRLILGFAADLGEGVAESLPGALKAFRGLIALARKESVKSMLREAVDAARTDLGVDGNALTELVRICLEGAAARLEAGVAAGDLSELSLRRCEWGLNLRGFRALALDELEWPLWDPETLMRALDNLYASKGVEDLLDRLARALDAATSLAGPIATLLEKALAAKTGSKGSVGAAANDAPSAAASAPAPAEPVCWYATWILRTEVRHRVNPGDTAIPPIAAVTYGCIHPRGMENLAYHSLWISDLAEHILHMISMERRDLVCNALNGAWNLFNCISAWAGKFSLPGWLQWTVTAPLTVLGGLESVRCSGPDDAVYPVIEILADAAEVMLYKRWCWLAREFVLSAATLANRDPDAQSAALAAAAAPWQDKVDAYAKTRDLIARETDLHMSGLLIEDLKRLYDELSDYRLLIRQGNRNQFHGIAYAFGEVGALVLPAILAARDRTNYGFQNKGITPMMVGKMFGGFGINMAFRATGILIGSALAREFPDDAEGVCFTVLCCGNERFLWNPRNDRGGPAAGRFFWLLANAFIEWAMQAVYLYLFTNNNTDQGRLAWVPSLPDLETAFPGYPGKVEDSPYKLPWSTEEVRQCVQNPLGIWNHYAANGFTYAIDFNHDAGSDVLACRSGIITDLAQGNPNNEKKKNSIEIMALRCFAGPARYAMAPVPPPPGAAFYTDDPPSGSPGSNTPIEAGTLFPPYWDVYGKPWPGLPPKLPLLWFGALLPEGSGLVSHLPKGTAAFAFLDPEQDRGLAGVDLTGFAFDDGTPIPAGVVFAPDVKAPPPANAPMYRKGTTFSPIPSRFRMYPYPTSGSEIAIPPPSDLTFLDGEPIPPGVALPPDCLPSPAPAHLPKPHPATPLYLPNTALGKYPSGAAVSDSTDFFNAGTAYAAVDPLKDEPVAKASATNEVDYTFFTPVAFAFMEFQHGITHFTRISESPASTPGQPEGPLTDCFETSDRKKILGRYVKQGRVVMLSGDTGTSLFNHLHVQAHVDAAANGRPNFTIPFVFSDVKHGIDHGLREASQGPGVPRAMTWYASGNMRSTFADADKEAAEDSP